MEVHHRSNRILIIDDDMTTRYALRRFLTQENFVVEEAATGYEGLRRAQSSPDLIILDVQLPDINGHEVCQKLRNSEKTSSIPIIQVSAAFTSPREKARGLNEGADAYFTHPIEPEVLIASVKALLRLKATEKKLAENEEELRRTLQAREDLLSIVSHDLKNPLSAIVLEAKLLNRYLEKIQDLKVRDFFGIHLDRIDRSATRMQNLIEDLLTIDKMSSGPFYINPSEFHANELIKDILDLLTPLAKQKDIQIQTQLLLSESPSIVKVDKNYIDRVFSNIIGNAIKFTPKNGNILVKVHKTESEVLYSIKDTGPGISPEQLPFIFDRFWQAKNTERMGSGLGLAIARGIIKLHGGRIWAESMLGKGSTFYFSLPQIRPSNQNRIN